MTTGFVGAVTDCSWAGADGLVVVFLVTEVTGSWEPLIDGTGRSEAEAVGDSARAWWTRPVQMAAMRRGEYFIICYFVV